MSKNNNTNPWSKEDLQIVKNNYLHIPVNKIIKLLSVPRTEKAIRHKASLLGLKKDVYVENYENIKFKSQDNIVYRLCKKCNNYLPNNSDYFSEDKKCTDGLRNVCRECRGENFKFNSPHYMWNENEISILKKTYKDYSNAELINKFFPYLTESQLLRKACQLNLKKSPETKEQIYAKMGIDSSMRLLQVGRWKGSSNPQFNNKRYGKLNPNYKGGISPLYEELRRNISQWKMDSAKQNQYRCIFTGDRFENIHHLYNFENIIKDTLLELEIYEINYICEYSEIELKNIINKCVEIHYRNTYGVCLKNKFHMLFHGLYGYTNNTALQFLEFTKRFEVGEFNSWLREHNFILDINYEFINYIKSTQSDKDLSA